MIFPKLKDIATTNVIMMEPFDTLWSAVDMMVKNNIHDVIIRDETPSFFGIVSMQNIIMLNADGTDFSAPLASIRHEKAPAYHMDASVLEIVDMMDANHQHICVINSQGELYGIISHHDIISNIDPKTLIERQTLGAIVRCGIIYTMDVQTKIQDVMTRMKDLNRDSIILVKDGENVGIVTVSDMAIALAKRHPMSSPVSDIMTSPIQTMPESATLKEALDFIKNKRFRRVIVASKEGKLLGILTKHDLVLATYNRWVDIVTRHSEEMVEINKILEHRNKHLEQIAFIDHLTGVYNRSLIGQWVESEKIKIAKYNLKPFSVLMADIDHFKNINDTFGHPAGDSVLKELADMVKKILRTTDFFARWGGEEFVALMPITTIEEAVGVAKKINEAIANTNFAEVGHITVSIGVAQYKDGEYIDAVIERADKALYRAKGNGRNRVEIEN